jgi:integrase
MGRPAKGVTVRWKRKWAYACFTWEGHEHRIALRTRSRSEAAEAAARAYSKVVSGEWRPVRRQPGKLLDLADLLDEWIESKRSGLDEVTIPTLEAYARRFVDYFEALDKITEATGSAYGMDRLAQVLRTTVNRELSYLREFLRWCRMQGALSTTPHIPRLPPKAQGKRSGPQRAKSVHISEAQAKEILTLLPEESKTIDGRKWPLRTRFAFMWETALRPETLSRLMVPDHWRPGARHLELTNEDDKARWGREVDLTDEAIRILEAVAPARGLIFGRHTYYKAIKRAAIAVLGETKGKLFAPYDFRHGRAKHLLDRKGSIRGVSYVLGHKLVSTTDKYLAPERSAGREALIAGGGVSVPKPDRPKRRRKKDA